VKAAEEEEVDRLYGLPLNEFTEARNALARRLRDQGQSASAERIKGLSKPSLPAWVVNQLARQRELDVQRLIKAGERLSSAQAEAIQAQTGDAFLDARRDEQHALERLAARAKEILSEASRGSAALDRIVATLRAASLTEEGRALLKEGRLTEELEPPGFEALAALRLPRRQSSRPPPKKASSPAGRQPPQGDKRRETERKRKLAVEARRRVRELRNRLRDLEARAHKAERNASQIKKELQAALAENDALDRERRRSQEELADAERDLAQLAPGD
jgi:hypothetical protein